MGKVKAAKVILGTMEVFKYLLVLAGVVTVGALLWMWASAHFFSFAVIMGIFLTLGLIIGIRLLVVWAAEVVEKDEIEEKLAQYRMKHGEDRMPRKSNGVYLFNEDPRPRGW